MTFVESIKSCFSGYIKFDGRASRSEFWFFMLFCFVGSLVTAFIPVVSLLFTAATFLPSLAVNVRRLHDIGKSGFWLLIALTGIGLLVLIFWWCQKSDQVDNAFGPAQA